MKKIMHKTSIRNSTPSASLNRREFLATGLAAMSGATLGLASPESLAGAEAGSSQRLNIEPGYIGPQYFDKHEEQALLEVLESKAPFRYWGSGKPVKVQRFEENFAKYMGTR